MKGCLAGIRGLWIAEPIFEVWEEMVQALEVVAWAKLEFHKKPIFSSVWKQKLRRQAISLRNHEKGKEEKANAWEQVEEKRSWRPASVE